MAALAHIHSTEAKQALKSELRAVLGPALSDTDLDQWYQMLMDEVNANSYIEYYTSVGTTYYNFLQYGKTEFYHDGSVESRKTVCITPLSKEEYIDAQAHRCEPDSPYHNYAEKWTQRSSEYFLTYWPGRFSEYIYYAKNIAGVPFVQIQIAIV